MMKRMDVTSPAQDRIALSRVGWKSSSNNNGAEAKPISMGWNRRWPFSGIVARRRLDATPEFLFYLLIEFQIIES